MAASFIKYNTATTAYFFIKSLTSYGVAAAGYSSYFTVWLSQDGGAPVNPAGSLTEVSSSDMPGLYSCDISAAETAYGVIACSLDPNMGYSYYQSDPFYIFTDKNKMQADLQEVQGVTAPAGNIADFFDGTGYGIQPASTATEVQADVAKVNASATAAKNLALGAESIQPAECTSGSTTSSIVGTGSLKTVDAFYVDRMLIFITGDLQYSARPVAAYDGSSKTFTVGTAFTSAPSSGDEFIIV
tara:strand:- start:27 stop:755 length:729 start_codon:yes stop_codon:yes gene_type:complete